MILSEKPVPTFRDHALGFADQARLGGNAWWRYALALGLVAGGGYGIVGPIGRLITSLLSRAGFAPGRDPPATLAFYGLIYALLLALMLAAFGFAHRRPWLSFITARGRPDWRLFIRSFAVMLGLCLVMLAANLYVAPTELSFTEAPAQVLRLAPFVLGFLPFQCLAEEVLFRGYLAQAVGRATRLFVLRLAVPALLFGLAHWRNPEMSQDQIWVGADYILAGLYLGLASLRGAGLEASLGVHLANNLSASLLVGVPQKVLPVESLWTIHALDARLGFFFDIALYAAHYGLVFRPRRSKNA